MLKINQQGKWLAVVLAVGTASACGGTVATESNNAVNEDVPENIQIMFQQKYPNAQPQWSKISYGYEAVFYDNGIEYEAEFSEGGEWLETEYDATEADIPSAILMTIRQQYPNAILDEFEIEITPNGQFYEVEIMTNSQEQELYFDRNGQAVPNQNEDS